VLRAVDALLSAVDGNIWARAAGQPLPGGLGAVRAGRATPHGARKITSTTRENNALANNFLPSSNSFHWFAAQADGRCALLGVRSRLISSAFAAGCLVGPCLFAKNGALRIPRLKGKVNARGLCPSASPAPAHPAPSAQQSLLGGFGTTATVDIVLADAATRPVRTIPSPEAGKPATQLLIVSSREDLAGEVKVNVFGGKKLDHTGIRIELKGIVGACGKGRGLQPARARGRGARALRANPSHPPSSSSLPLIQS
jgi:hypothetical protein